MWGHLLLLLRDIAVNESDQERVSDSGAIRSGLVPQLKHNAIHRRSSLAGGPSQEGIAALAEALQPPVAVDAPSTGRKIGRMRQRARKIRGSLRAGRCTQENVTPCPHWSPTRYPLDLRNDWSSVTLHRLRCGFLLGLPPRGPPLSVHRRSCLELQPRCYSTGSRLWSRQADDNRRSLRELWLRNGRLPDLVEAGILRQRDARAAQGAA
jgi:hypothetical protein